jgi:hypothetical protein
MMPYEPLYDKDRGINQESFVIETRPLRGYSGSPVFAYQIMRILSFGIIL